MSTEPQPRRRQHRVPNGLAIVVVGACAFLLGVVMQGPADACGGLAAPAHTTTSTAR